MVAKRRPQPDKGVMHSLGEFVGEVMKGVRTDPSKPAKRVASRRVEEETRDSPRGKVILRRTVIEEIIVPPKPNRP